MTTPRTDSSMYSLAFVAVFAALYVVLAFVAIPIGVAGVPIVVQNAAVILGGLVLGARRGTYASLLFLSIGLLGLPILSGGRSTLVALASPTVGYVIGYVASAFVAGLIASRAPLNQGKVAWVVLGLAGAAGLATQYGLGIVGLVLRADLSFTAAFVAQGAFIVPDIIKVLLVVIVAVRVRATSPDLFVLQKGHHA